MFLDIKQLELHPLDFEEEFQPGVIDLGQEARQRTPLKASGHAEVVEEHHGKHQIIKDIRLRGSLSDWAGIAVRPLPGNGARRTLNENLSCSIVRLALMPAKMSSRSPLPKPRSAIIREKVFCLRMCCVSRCCSRCR